MAFIFFLFVEVGKLAPRLKVVPKIVKRLDVTAGGIRVAKSGYVASDGPTGICRYHGTEYLEGGRERIGSSIIGSDSQTISQSNSIFFFRSRLSTSQMNPSTSKRSIDNFSFTRFLREGEHLLKKEDLFIMLLLLYPNLPRRIVLCLQHCSRELRRQIQNPLNRMHVFSTLHSAFRKL